VQNTNKNINFLHILIHKKNKRKLFPIKKYKLISYQVNQFINNNDHAYLFNPYRTIKLKIREFNLK